MAASSDDPRPHLHSCAAHILTLHDRAATRLPSVNETVPPLVITPTDVGYDVSGEIDAHTAPLLAEAVAKSTVDELSLDLGGVEFIDSSGLRVLIETHRTRAAAGQSLVLVGPSAVVVQLFRIAGLDDYFNVTDSPT
jgi:anti-sigma B factor antagonist